MKLTVLNSGSKANGYVLQNDTEAIVIECGCSVSDCLQALNFQSSKVKACLITHEHGDHAKYIEKYMEYFQVFCSHGTAQAIKYKGQRRPIELKPLKGLYAGNFYIRPFGVEHDCSEPFGYLIEHPEIGKLLFATDTYYIKYKFDELTNVMIECNYSLEILNKNVKAGVIHPAVKDRTLQSHMSLENCIKMLNANDLSQVSQVVLLHLSGKNSSDLEFKEKVELSTGKNVIVAKKGVNVILNKTPF